MVTRGSSRRRRSDDGVCLDLDRCRVCGATFDRSIVMYYVNNNDKAVDECRDRCTFQGFN